MRVSFECGQEFRNECLKLHKKNSRTNGRNIPKFSSSLRMNFPVKGQRFESCGLGFIVGWGSIFFRDWDVQGPRDEHRRAAGSLGRSQTTRILSGSYLCSPGEFTQVSAVRLLQTRNSELEEQQSKFRRRSTLRSQSNHPTQSQSAKSESGFHHNAR